MIDRSNLHPLAEVSPESNELERWLAVATRDLCEEANSRVRAEVEAHYMAARDAYAANGGNEIAAEQAALASLGDAKRARRRYARTELTKSDEKLLKHLGNRDVAATIAVCFALGISNMVLHVTRHGSFPVILFALATSCVWAAVVWFAVSQRRRLHGDAPSSFAKLVVAETIAAVLMPMFLVVFFYISLYDRVISLASHGAVTHIAVGLGLVFAYAFVLREVRRLRGIRHKLSDTQLRLKIARDHGDTEKGK